MYFQVGAARSGILFSWSVFFLSAVFVVLIASVNFGTASAEPLKARSEETICARNYLRNDQGADPCAQAMPRFHYLLNKSRPDVLICGMSYAESYCETSPQEFNYAVTADGSSTCVVNFHNPPVVDYCETVPQYYDWVSSFK